MTFNKIGLGLLLIIVIISGGFAFNHFLDRDALPDGIATGHGRLEVEEVHVAVKYGGRVADVMVDEGDMVEANDVLARLDTAELDAHLARAEAEIHQAQESVVGAEALIAQRESELKFAEQELGRASILVQRGHTSQEIADQRLTQRDTARATLRAAKAQLATARATVRSAEAAARQIEVQLDEATIRAPRLGRVQYRLAEPGEVLANGGRIVTLLDLTDVYMTIFLPTSEAGRLAYGAEARIQLDAAPEFMIPANVSFVAANAQFTPKEVETRSEREKLMFRVKVQIDPELLLQYIDLVKTGLPGDVFVSLTSELSWPERFAINLPPRPSG
ncbi:MAG: HlyD family efflux transporter periplasmic adaptor subunit [Pseudomonadota bacterium]